MVAGPELSRFGISQQGDVLGGYLKIEPLNPTAEAKLLAAGLMFHLNSKSEIDSLSLLPVVR